MRRRTKSTEPGQIASPVTSAYDAIRQHPTSNGKSVGQRLVRSSMGGYRRDAVNDLILDLLAATGQVARQRDGAELRYSQSEAARTAAEQRVDNLLSGNDVDWVVDDVVKQKIAEAKTQAAAILDNAETDASKLRQDAYERTAEMDRREAEQQERLAQQEAEQRQRINEHQTAMMQDASRAAQAMFDEAKAALDAETENRERRNAADLAIIHRQRRDFLAFIGRMQSKFSALSTEFGQGQGFFETFTHETANLIRQQEEEQPELRGEREQPAALAAPASPEASNHTLEADSGAVHDEGEIR